MSSITYSTNLNEHFGDVPVGFSILVLKDDNTTVKLNKAFDLCSKLKVDLEASKIVECKVSYEYVPSNDSYLKNINQVPPWYMFQGFNYERIEYAISANYIVSDDYHINGYEYSPSDRQKKAGELLTALSGKIPTKIGALSTTEKQTLTTAIKEYVRGMGGIDREMLSNAKIKKILLPQSKTLTTGVVISSTFSGDDNSTIKYEVSIHSNLSDIVKRTDAITKSYKKEPEPVQHFNYTSLYNAANLFTNTISLPNTYKMSDLIAVFFGRVRSTTDPTKFEIGNIKTNFTNIYFPNIPDDTAAIKSSVEELENYLNRQNTVLDFSGLEIYDIIDSSVTDKDGNDKTEWQKQIRKAANGNVFSNVTDIVKLARKDNPNYPTNLKTLSNGFIANVNKFTQMAESFKNGTDLIPYLNLIKNAWGVEYTIDNINIASDGNKIYRRLIFYKGAIATNTSLQKPAPNPKGNDLDIYSSNKILIMDYGGLVVNFNHSIRTGSINLKNTTKGQSNITVSLEGSYSVKIELNSQAIRDYAKTQYGIDPDTQSFINIIEQRVRENPDEFLLEFVSYTVQTSANAAKPVVPISEADKGSQLLKLTLRHPVLGISPGMPIYFKSISESKSEDISILGLFKISKSGFYVLPDKVTGVYVITKVSFEFSPKDNICVQVLECER